MEITADYLVIGTGIAGLSFALEAAQQNQVAIITKKADFDSNTNRAQGGIAAVLASDDSTALHVEDTLQAGAGLCNPEVVRLVAREAPAMVSKLINWGVEFTKRQNGALDLGREGGHSKNRIVHAADLTGAAIERALLERVKTNNKITIYENHFAIDLITEHHLFDVKEKRSRRITCWGAYVLDTIRTEVHKFLAKGTILTTGGAGRSYLYTTNPAIATGDGLAMVFRAGGEVANLEFAQFHPTSLYHPDGDSFLITESLRGYGAVLRTKDGKTFMEKYHPMKSLAARDIVARAIDRELKLSGDECVYLDATQMDPEKTKEEFPNIYEKCKSFGIDITEISIPVVPAAHYMCGGVRTDIHGKTSIRNLYASGEVACTGLHGANRLASNSLSEALVFSHRAYQDSLNVVQNEIFTFPNIPDWNEEDTFNAEEWIILSHDRQEIQRLMWDYVGIVRSDYRLKKAQRRIRLIANEIEEFYKKTKVTGDLIELRNIATVALLIIRSALMRKESRGLHFNTDYPQPDDSDWLKDTIIRNEASLNYR